MQDLVPDDLLPREPVSFGEAHAPGPMGERTALVTGAAGSIGAEITEQLLRAGVGRLVLVDLNENGLYLHQRSLARRYPRARIEVEIADIRDPSRMRSLFQRYRPHDVFHAAAHKHVPLMESAPCEAVKNNVGGTLHVARAADACGAERFVYVSTDKAVRPTSVMGATKRLGEEIVRSMARRSDTRFSAVRFGNVLGSAGSVVPLFREQIAAGGPVTVTDPDVRRYFMTISEAVALVLTAGYGDYGELCVLDMGEQIRIVDLARHMITMAGHVPDVDVAIEYTGLRPGEKLFEELLTEEEEGTRRVHDKIFVADCRPPAVDLDDRLEDLIATAQLEHAAGVVALLRSLVPTYLPAQHDLPDARTA
jgi:FlaA1/EpsC-like NDP-sugar epimerase